MKKLHFTLCTILAAIASFNIHAMEPGKAMEHPVDTTLTVRQNDHQLTEAQKNKAAKDSAKQIANDAKSGNATEEKYTQRIKELTDSSEPLTSQEAQELAKNQQSLKTIQDQKSAQPTTGIPLDEAEAPAVETTPENAPTTETGRTDSTDSLKTVDLTDQATAQKQAQNVKNSSGVTSFIKSMVDRLFGKDANNPEIKQAMDQAEADAQAQQWWSPWDGSKFQTWYDNTVESFKQIKKSLSQSTKNNNVAADALKGFTSVDLNDLENGQEYSLFYDGRVVER